VVTRFAYHKINIVIPIALGMIGFLGYGYYFREGEITYALVGLMLLAIAGLTMAELLISKIELGEDRLVIRRLWKRQELERAKIQEVAWEKGCPVTVLYEGRWITLPALGISKLSITDSIRGWLKGQGETPNPAGDDSEQLKR